MNGRSEGGESRALGRRGFNQKEYNAGEVVKNLCQTFSPLIPVFDDPRLEGDGRDLLIPCRGNS